MCMIAVGCGREGGLWVDFDWVSAEDKHCGRQCCWGTSLNKVIEEILSEEDTALFEFLVLAIIFDGCFRAESGISSFDEKHFVRMMRGDGGFRAGCRFRFRKRKSPLSMIRRRIRIDHVFSICS